MGHAVQRSSSVFVRHSWKCFCHSYVAIFFIASFPFAFISISNVSEGNFVNKRQNLIFACCFKDTSKSDKWKIHFFRNCLQLSPTVAEMNSRWLYIFLINGTSLQKRYFPSMNPYMNVSDHSRNLLALLCVAGTNLLT